MGLGLLSIVILFSCLLFSAFFSGMETALTSLPAARLKKIIEERPIFSSALGLWLRKPNEVLTTALVGNNIVNTLAAAVATVIAQSMFASYAISAATFFITVALIIFGEVTPKTFARHNAEKVAPVGMLLMLPFYVTLMPITRVLTKFSTRLVKLIGGKPSTNGPFATEEDIAYLIKLGNQEGVLTRNEGNLLQSVIDFRDTVAKESMVPRTEICSFDVHATLDEVRARVKTEGHTRWPVYEGNIDNIVGLFHTKDLLRTLDATIDPKTFSLRDFLRPAKFVPDMMKIGNLLKEFQAGKAHLAIVVDEYGGTAGIISLEDVLEEIVGDIRDEYDDEEQERTVHQIDANNYLVDGKENIFELGKLLDVSFPESDGFDSLGGFLIAHFGRMPKVGHKITFEDCTFAIKKADEKRIMQVHIHQARRRPALQLSNDSVVEERAAA